MDKLLDLSAQNLILKAFKQSEDEPKEWIIRCYECLGTPADLLIENELELSVTRQVDLLERNINLAPVSSVNPASVQQKGKICQIAPWQIASFALARENKSPNRGM